MKNFVLDSYWLSLGVLLFNFWMFAVVVGKAESAHYEQTSEFVRHIPKWQQELAYSPVHRRHGNRQRVSLTSASANRSLPNKTRQSELKSSNFDSSLYQAVKCTNGNNKNLVISPYSLKRILALANLAADGKTAQEIQKQVNFSNSKEEFIQSQTELDRKFQNLSDVELLTANKIYTAVGKVVHPEFTYDLGRLGGDLEKIDFSQSDMSSQKINQWVKANTRGKITRLVEPGSLTADTSWIIVNSVYFKGLWKYPFLAANIQRESFLLGRGRTVEVDMMSQEAELQFVQMRNSTPRVTIVSLPYQGSRLSMLIYFPLQRRSNSGSANNDLLGELDAVEKWLSSQTPEQILNDLPEPQKVWFYLPKFKVRSSLQLKTAFKSIGLASMFDQSSANFSNIFAKSDASSAVTDIFHESVVEVTAEGTTAAASSGFAVTSVSAPPTIKVNRPFVFQILDKETHIILFQGRVVNPNEISETTEEVDLTAASEESIMANDNNQGKEDPIPIVTPKPSLLSSHAASLTTFGSSSEGSSSLSSSFAGSVLTSSNSSLPSVSVDYESEQPSCKAHVNEVMEKRAKEKADAAKLHESFTNFILELKKTVKTLENELNRVNSRIEDITNQFMNQPQASAKDSSKPN